MKQELCVFRKKPTQLLLLDTGICGEGFDEAAVRGRKVNNVHLLIQAMTKDHFESARSKNHRKILDDKWRLPQPKITGNEIPQKRLGQTCFFWLQPVTVLGWNLSVNAHQKLGVRVGMIPKGRPAWREATLPDRLEDLFHHFPTDARALILVTSWS